MENKKVVIAHSDYTRAQLEKDEVHELTVGNCSARAILDVIRQHEKDGYQVKFETSIWRLLFFVPTYKIVAYPNRPKTGSGKRVKYYGMYTITTNGVKRDMTEEEIEKFEKLMNDKRKLMDGVFDDMDKFFKEVDKQK